MSKKNKKVAVASKKEAVDENTPVEAKKVAPVTVDKAKVNKEAEKMAKKEKASVDKKKEWLLGDPMEVKRLIASLAEEAIQVKIKVSAWRGTGSDKEVVQELAGIYNGAMEGFSVSLKFLPPEYRKELGRRIKYMQDFVLINTLPMAEGWRLLATKLYPQLKGAVENSRLQVLDYVKQMASDACYAKIHEYAKRVLGKAYDAGKIPSQAEIMKAFKVEWSTQSINIPTKLDGLGGDELKELQNDMVEEYSRKYSTAIMSLLEGLSETLEKLIEKLEGNQDRDEYKMVLRMAESRIREITTLDVFKSKKVRIALEKINTEILEPLRHDVQELKQSGDKRKELVKKVKQVKKDAFDDVV